MGYSSLLLSFTLLVFAFLFLKLYSHSNNLQPLIVERNGEQLAVFLMDTQVGQKAKRYLNTIHVSNSQGTFDYRTTVRENMTVFALSTMTSSVLMYNVQHGIREDHLQVHLIPTFGSVSSDSYLNFSVKTNFK